MKINTIQPYKFYTPNFCKNTQRRDFFDRKDDFESDIKERTNNIKSDLGIYLDTAKKNLWLAKGSMTKRHFNAFISDPKAYLYGYLSPVSGKLIDTQVIAQVPLKNRKTKEIEMLDVQRASFLNGSEIFSINKGKEKLAYVDVDTRCLDVINVNYASTIVGREEYRGLFLTLMQAVIETCINDGFIPEIQAMPVQIGNKDFKRSTLYGLYGAEYKIVQGQYGSEPRSIVSREKVIKMLESVQNSPKRKFILPWTEHNFNILKNGG